MLLLIASAVVTAVLVAWLVHRVRSRVRPPLQGAAADLAAKVFDSADEALSEAAAGVEKLSGRFGWPLPSDPGRHVVQVRSHEPDLPAPRAPEVILPRPRDAADDRDVRRRPQAQ